MTARDILERYRKGEIDAGRAERLLRLDHIDAVGGHTLFDASRAARKHVPEVVMGGAKAPEDIASIVSRALESSPSVLVSRADEAAFQEVRRTVEGKVEYNKAARMIIAGELRPSRDKGLIGVMSAGTSDMGAAEEARLTAEAMGVEAITAYDVGLAGFHRFLAPLADMLDEGADAIVVAAGMEGALATAVASLSDVPVIGLPTSVGYGMGGGGISALTSMLQSCSPGLTVVNIDNGVGAGAGAALISIRRRSKT